MGEDEDTNWSPGRQIDGSENCALLLAGGEPGGCAALVVGAVPVWWKVPCDLVGEQRHDELVTSFVALLRGHKLWPASHDEAFGLETAVVDIHERDRNIGLDVPGPYAWG